MEDRPGDLVAGARGIGDTTGGQIVHRKTRTRAPAQVSLRDARDPIEPDVSLQASRLSASARRSIRAEVDLDVPQLRRCVVGAAEQVSVGDHPAAHARPQHQHDEVARSAPAAEEEFPDGGGVGIVL